ncbi:Bifunctional heparan sulfate N-deacetylase/N-sulfotransferase 1 [Balamuthia mandrillaris]
MTWRTVLLGCLLGLLLLLSMENLALKRSSLSRPLEAGGCEVFNDERALGDTRATEGRKAASSHALSISNDTRFLIGVGCQKGETSTLFKSLRGVEWANPPVIMKDGRPRGRKELFFFINDVPAEGVPAGAAQTLLQDYLSHWPVTTNPQDKDTRVMFEFTPDYIYHKRAPWLMQEVLRGGGKEESNMLPFVKLVFLLRDPAKRAFSGYFQQFVGPAEAFHNNTAPAERQPNVQQGVGAVQVLCAWMDAGMLATVLPEKLRRPGGQKYALHPEGIVLGCHPKLLVRRLSA